MQLKREKLPFVWTWRDTGITALLTGVLLVAQWWVAPVGLVIWPLIKVWFWAEQSSTVKARWIRAISAVLLPAVGYPMFLFQGLGLVPWNLSPLIRIGLWVILVGLELRGAVLRFRAESMEDSRRADAHS